MRIVKSVVVRGLVGVVLSGVVRSTAMVHNHSSIRSQQNLENK